MISTKILCPFRFANSKEKYHLVHPCRLISSFVIHFWTVSHLNLLQVKFNFSSKYLQLSRDWFKVSKGAKIRSRYNQVPHPTQDTNGKVTNSQLDTTNESQEVSPFPAGDHKAQINRRAQRHSKHKTEQKH